MKSIPLEDYIQSILIEVGGFDAMLTPEEFLHVAIDAADGVAATYCVLCGVDTWKVHEYYMVKERIWKKHGPHKGMLCIGCLEERMGRKLVAKDFTDAPINTDPEDKLWARSVRLRDRLSA